jgi:tRNA threonylcarbamoyladenosine biosynthesis protein TsaE
VGPVAFASPSPARTRALGRALGRLLEPGDFVGLVGELGAGKTLFVRGVADGADVPEEQVSSPTFAIVYPYQGRLPLYHADLYRVADADELYATGFPELVGGDGAVLVEWIDRIWSAAPAERLEVRIEASARAKRRRRLVAQARGARAESLLAAWKKAVRK